MSETKPVDYDELFPGRFLKAGLFKGKSPTLTIKDVDTEDLPQDKGGDRTRGVLSFMETDLQLVLNSTNGQCLMALFGRKVQDWKGHRVTFMPDRDRFGKEVVDCIRVKGSPELEADTVVEIKLPRKKPIKRTLYATGKPATTPAQDREPGSEG